MDWNAQKKEKKPRMKEHRAVSSLTVSRPECLYTVHVVFLYIFLALEDLESQK